MDNPNKRIFVAIALSLLFLIPYMYFFAPKPPQKPAANPAAQNLAESAAPDSAQNAAPDAAMQNNAPAKIHQPSAATNAPISAENGANLEIIARVEAESFSIEIDKLGRIHNVFLKNSKYLGEDKKPLSLLAKGEIKPLELRFQDKATNQKAFETPYSTDKNLLNLDDGESVSLVLTQDLGDLVVKKTLVFHKNLQYDANISLSRPAPYFLSNGMRPSADSSAYVFKGLIIKKDDGKLEKIEDGDAKIGENLSFNAQFIASVDRYYATILYADSPFGVVTDADGKENPIAYAAFEDSANLKGYIGPKNYRELRAISPILSDAVEYGVITFFAKPLFWLLSYLFDAFKNWGWAIIALTLIVRIVLFPLTYKGMVSMQKLKDLAPQLKEIQTKYKGDGAKLQAHMMDLYKKHNVNPMGGCLPLLLQIPVFFAIYRVLYNAVELKASAWLLWIHDLSAMDPYFILPILMGASMYLQQHLSPATFNDPMQEKVFKFLPVVFTIFLITFPAGLILYWTVNNIFSIIQQLLINRAMKQK